MELIMLGTGNALVTKCYNTCFVLKKNNECFLVDGGGGNTLLSQLEKASIDFRDIHDIFITHKHIDHLLGIIWMIRVMCQNMKSDNYHGDVNIYGHDEVISLLKELCYELLQKKQTDYFDTRVHFHIVDDRESTFILNNKVTFFDIYSSKAKQFGFMMNYKDKKIVCCGDEPHNKKNNDLVYNADYLLHEAFCLYEEEKIFHAYEKHHSTVKDACLLAQELNVKNLVLYHTEDKHIDERKELYTKEGKDFFKGTLYVPYDLERIIIDE